MPACGLLTSLLLQSTWRSSMRYERRVLAVFCQYFIAATGYHGFCPP